MNDDAPLDRRPERVEPDEHGFWRTSSTANRQPWSRDRVYDHIFFRGEQGSTDEEGYVALEMMSQSYGPRRGELVALGLVKPSTMRRYTSGGRSATVWVASAFVSGKRKSSGGNQEQGGEPC